jgi:hypothetical protein
MRVDDTNVPRCRSALAGLIMDDSDACIVETGNDLSNITSDASSIVMIPKS